MDQEFEKIYRQAQECFDEKRYDEAERLLLKLLERSPRGYADVFNRLGIINSHKGWLERAADYFEKALSLNPKYTEASLNLTVTFNEMRRFDDAERVFLQAAKVITSEPASMDPYIQGRLANEHGKLGDAYYDLARYDEAMNEYRAALALRPNFVDILTKMGMALREKNELDKAIETFVKAKQTNSKYLPAYIHLGIAYFMKGQRDRAQDEWKMAQSIDPSNNALQVYLNLARKN